MKPYFSQLLVNGNDPRPLREVNCFRVKSVTGGVTASFGEGQTVTLEEGDVYALPIGLFFDLVIFKAESGAQATIVHGIGSTGSATGSTVGGGAALQPTSGSPEGVLDAADGQFAYDTSSGALYANPASSGLSGWVQLLG